MSEYQIPLKVIPTKPRYGAPCNGCGVCCQQELCPLGTTAFGAVPAPCPALHWVQGRFWCGLALMEYEARRQDMTIVPRLADALRLGQGCDMED